MMVLVVAALVGGSAFAEQSIELTGTLRDFQMSHSDFEASASSYPLITGMVKPELSADDKPVLNPGEGGCYEIKVSSSRHEISNVVLELDNGTEYKFDGQSGYEQTYAVPQDYDGQKIVGVWVKAGNNSSGDGPGYGEYFESEYFEYQDTHVVLNGDETISVTFYCDVAIPELWRIGSEQSFDQWFRNTAGVNQSTQHTITLEQRSDLPHIYRFEASKHNGKSFFPLDGQLFGNEGLPHNYHFTYEVHTKFTYTDPAERDYDLTFSFSGDDDVWVFINRQLAVDLGGVHSERFASVNVDDIAGDLGLVPGESYDFHFFFAERHTTESNFTMETTIQFLSPLYD
jgi:fibro-slime domain-containing protein